MSETLMRSFGDYVLFSVPVQQPFPSLGLGRTRYSCILKYKGETVDRTSGTADSEAHGLQWATGAILRHKKALEGFIRAAS